MVAQVQQVDAQGDLLANNENAPILGDPQDLGIGIAVAQVGPDGAPLMANGIPVMGEPQQFNEAGIPQQVNPAPAQGQALPVDPNVHITVADWKSMHPDQDESACSKWLFLEDNMRITRTTLDGLQPTFKVPIWIVLGLRGSGMAKFQDYLNELFSTKKFEDHPNWEPVSEKVVDEALIEVNDQLIALNLPVLDPAFVKVRALRQMKTFWEVEVPGLRKKLPTISDAQFSLHIHEQTTKSTVEARVKAQKTGIIAIPDMYSWVQEEQLLNHNGVPDVNFFPDARIASSILKWWKTASLKEMPTVECMICLQMPHKNDEVRVWGELRNVNDPNVLMRYLWTFGEITTVISMAKKSSPARNAWHVNLVTKIREMLNRQTARPAVSDIAGICQNVITDVLLKVNVRQDKFDEFFDEAFFLPDTWDVGAYHSQRMADKVAKDAAVVARFAEEFKRKSTAGNPAGGRRRVDDDNVFKPTKLFVNDDTLPDKKIEAEKATMDRLAGQKCNECNVDIVGHPWRNGQPRACKPGQGQRYTELNARRMQLIKSGKNRQAGAAITSKRNCVMCDKPETECVSFVANGERCPLDEAGKQKLRDLRKKNKGRGRSSGGKAKGKGGNNYAYGT